MSDSRVVTKEERFASEDIDRNWPRNLPPSIKSPIAFERPSSTGTTSTRDSFVASSPDKTHSRALFNERSNRLEPLGPKSAESPVEKMVPSRKLQHPEQDTRKCCDVPVVLPPHHLYDSANFVESSTFQSQCRVASYEQRPRWLFRSRRRSERKIRPCFRSECYTRTCNSRCPRGSASSAMGLDNNAASSHWTSPPSK